MMKIIQKSKRCHQKHDFHSCLDDLRWNMMELILFHAAKLAVHMARFLDPCAMSLGSQGS
jgi:hypothetical protein